jgi:type VI secretion system protein ImpH
MSESAVERQLAGSGYEFSFFQAVRLLQRMGGRQPVGHFSEPSAEAVEFGAQPTLAFPPAEIQSLEMRPGAVPRMLTAFFGLIGPVGVLPPHYNAYLIERLYDRDRTALDFLNVLHHRTTSLFYRAWEKHRFEIAYERRGEDSLSPRLLDMVGLGASSLRNRQSIPDTAWFAYAGLISQYPRSAGVLEQILADYFDVPVEVQPFAGSWRQIDPDAWTRLDNAGRSEQLGIGMVLGDEVWDQQSLVRVRIGPLPMARYKQFLPDGDAYRPLIAMSRFVCGEDIDVEVQMVLAREDAPRFALGVDGAEPPRLGWISWIFSRPLDRDPDETILPIWQVNA